MMEVFVIQERIQWMDFRLKGDTINVTKYYHFLVELDWGGCNST